MQCGHNIKHQARAKMTTELKTS